MAKPKAAPATEVLERIDPDEDFSDVDGDLNNEFALSNPDPDKHYVWVHNDRESIGLYRSNILKYDLEHSRDGGVRSLTSEPEADAAIVVRDHVLMACSRTRFEKKARFDKQKNQQDRKQLSLRNRADVRLERDDGGRWSARQEARI